MTSNSSDHGLSNILNLRKFDRGEVIHVVSNFRHYFRYLLDSLWLYYHSGMGEVGREGGYEARLRTKGFYGRSVRTNKDEDKNALLSEPDSEDAESSMATQPSELVSGTASFSRKRKPSRREN